MNFAYKKFASIIKHYNCYLFSVYMIQNNFILIGLGKELENMVVIFINI